MRICVFGAGAVGGHLAARLSAAGNEVSVIARGPTLEAVRKNGLLLHTGDEQIRGQVKASDNASDLGRQDAVIVTLKANGLGAFAESAAPLLGPDTAVVFAQNGIPWWYGIGLDASKRAAPDLSRLDPGGALAKAIAPGNVVGGVVYSANEVLEPGVIRNNVPGNNMLVIGEIDDRDSPRIRQLRQVLEKTGMASPPNADIRLSVWSKLIQNLGSSTLCLLTGGNIAEVRSSPELMPVLKNLAEEGRAIAQAYGFALEKAPARPGGGQTSGLITHKPSMLQDYERGRPLEVEAQLMCTLNFGRAAGVPVPTLETLIPLAAYKAAFKGLYTP